MTSPTLDASIMNTDQQELDASNMNTAQQESIISLLIKSKQIRVMALVLISVFALFIYSLINFGLNITDSSFMFFYLFLSEMSFVCAVSIRHKYRTLLSDISALSPNLNDGNASLHERRIALKQILSFRHITEEILQNWEENSNQKEFSTRDHSCMHSELSEENVSFVDDTNAIVCGICIDEFSLGEKIINPTNCTHIFHAECIVHWLEHHYDCPICRELMVMPEQVAEKVKILRNSESCTKINESTNILENLSIIEIVENRV